MGGQPVVVLRPATSLGPGPETKLRVEIRNPEDKARELRALARIENSLDRLENALLHLELACAAMDIKRTPNGKLVFNPINAYEVDAERLLCLPAPGLTREMLTFWRLVDAAKAADWPRA